MLVGAELLAFHQHLDTCPGCLELASVLGCMGGRNEHTQPNFAPHVAGTSADKPARTAGPSAKVLRTALTTLFVCHAYSSFTLLPTLWQAFRADVPTKILSYWALYDLWLPFALAFGSLGLLLAVVVQVYSLFRARPAVFSLRSYAILALATGFLAPIGLGVLVTSHWRPKQKRGARPRRPAGFAG